jgi:hypothetical protein
VARLNQSAIYRKRLEKAMSAVPDNSPMPWRGGTVTAGQLKRELLAVVAGGAAPAAAPAPATLAQLPRRRIVLPADWPARPSDRCGPRMAPGTRTPWPVTRAEIAADYTLLGCVRAVARFNTGADKAAWRCAPVDAGGPVSRSAASTRTILRSSPCSGVPCSWERPPRATRGFYLQETGIPRSLRRWMSAPANSCGRRRARRGGRA